MPDIESALSKVYVLKWHKLMPVRPCSGRLRSSIRRWSSCNQLVPGLTNVEFKGSMSQGLSMGFFHQGSL